MSTGIPNKHIGDKRNTYVDDAYKIRQIQIKNLQRETIEANVLWASRQRDLYQNSIQVSPITTLSQVITSEISRDPMQDYQKATANLLTLADNKTAQYILDRLEPEQIAIMNLNFPALVIKIKKDYKNLDKNVFVNFVSTMKDDIHFLQPDDVSKEPALTVQGDLNEKVMEAQKIPDKQAFDASIEAYNKQQADLEQVYMDEFNANQKTLIDNKKAHKKQNYDKRLAI